MSEDLYLNDPGYEVPENTFLIVPHALGLETKYEEILENLKGKVKRDWFDPHAYYCLPLNIGNQYGYIVKSLHTFDMIWDGTTSSPSIVFEDPKNENFEYQTIKPHFGNGIVTIQNRFAIKTPPGINTMLIQPPNFFISGCTSLTAVIETDQIRRDFTFNFKVTVPDYRIHVQKGDPIGAFIPIPRYFVENFKLAHVEDYFPEFIHAKEAEEAAKLGVERETIDRAHPHVAGRRYFNGVHTNGCPYTDHQKRMK